MFQKIRKFWFFRT